MASANLEGFHIFGQVQFTKNVASGNRSFGLFGSGSVLEIRRNSFLGNGGPGISLSGHSTVTDIIDNNIFGNGSCGLQNFTATLVTASGNFWGAATGPGSDPADAVCNDASSTTIVEPVAAQPVNINVKIGL